MIQAIMTAPGEIEFVEVPKPINLKADEVLLRIERIGVCGSDIHVYHGKHPFTTYPIVQGHEYCGIVVDKGKDVTRVQIGTLATGRPQLVCGKCEPCKRGQYNICSNLLVQGFQAPGCASIFFIVPEDRIVAIPDCMNSDQGALVEPCSVAAHATRIVASLTKKNVVVAGAGPIGNLVAQFAMLRGAKSVLITDLSDFRLMKALECGIPFAANLREESFEDAVLRAFGIEGFQVGFEAVGIQGALDYLVNGIEKSGSIVIIGVYEEHPRVNMGFVCEHELCITGSMMYLHEDYEEAVNAISNNKMNTTSLITHHFPFEKYLEAYKFIDVEKETSLKVMIDL